jgi:cysteinyl-tRNA synthetase
MASVNRPAPSTADNKWPDDTSDARLHEQIAKADTDFTASLNNDLNTAEARAAIFDLLRNVNTAADQERLTRDNAEATLAVLEKFDAVFAVLQPGEDRDAELTRNALAWAEANGRMAEVAPEVLEKFGANSLTDAQIQQLIDDRAQAKRQRNFARADAIRNELLGKGILLEDSKDGVRWKRS